MDREESLGKLLENFKERDNLSVLKDTIQQLQNNKESLDSDQIVEVCSALTSVFYEDAQSNPAYDEVIKAVQDYLAFLGEPVVAPLIEEMGQCDAESLRYFSRTLGAVGEAAIKPLLNLYTGGENEPFLRIAALSSLSKIKGASILEHIPVFIKACSDRNNRVKSVALQCVGRIIENAPKQNLSSQQANLLFTALFARLQDSNHSSRSRTVTAIGEMAKKELLNGEELTKAKKAFDAILGKDEFDWDRAFIVRKEAQNYYEYVQSGGEG